MGSGIQFFTHRGSFSGDANKWQPIEFDLTRYIEEPIAWHHPCNRSWPTELWRTQRHGDHHEIARKFSHLIKDLGMV